MLPYLENLHFPSPPGSSAGSPHHEGGETVIKFDEWTFPQQNIFSDCDRASAEDEEGGAGEGGGGGGGGSQGGQADACQEEVQDHLLH